VSEAATIGVVEHTCRELRRGDMLAPFEWPADVAPELPGQAVYEAPARMLFGQDGRAMAAAGQFIVIDQGATTGDRMTLFQPPTGGSGAPVSVSGEAVVVLVAETWATLWLLESSRPVRTGDSTARHR